MTIDRNSPIPLYFQLKRILLEKIDNSGLNPGDMLPTEQQIQEEYDVSRTTVRQALSDLVDEGKITRHRGRGTFVAKPKVRHMPDQYPDLADHMIEQGLTPGWRLLHAGWVDPTDEIIKTLQVGSGKQVFQLERLRLENNDPIGYQIAHLAPQFATAIDDNTFTAGGSLRYLNKLDLLQTGVADRTLEAIEANEKHAELLSIPLETALLRVLRVIYTQDRTPIEMFNGVYLGNRFQYHINNMRAVRTINA
jgi:GntR family transcriptional regulator